MEGFIKSASDKLSDANTLAVPGKTVRVYETKAGLINLGHWTIISTSVTITSGNVIEGRPLR